MLKKWFLCGLLAVGTAALANLDDLEDINFPLNSAVVVDGFQGLDLLAAVMAKHGNLELDVVGHTDSIGSVAYNKQLSMRRAEAVKSYLVSKGVNDGKVSTSGDGISDQYDNKSREGRFQNRRVSLVLYETINGARTKVNYPRLIELFFGDRAGGNGGDTTVTKGDHDAVMVKLTDLEKMYNDLDKKIAENHAAIDLRLKNIENKVEDHASHHMSMGGFSGVSVAAGVDDDSDFTGQVRGLYFKTVSDHIAVQAEGDFSYYDFQKEGQVDVGVVYQNGSFKAAAGGSYKWVSIDGFEAGRLGQGAFMADYLFGSGKIGVYATIPFADGDVISSAPVPGGGSFIQELYLSVPSQYGLDFGVAITDKIDLSGYAAAIDGETDADFTAGLKLDVLVADYMSWFIEAELNESLLVNDDDSNRFQTGLRFGSWSQARYNVTDQITPVNFPNIRYEILERIRRNGNSGPVADAGNVQNNVPAGTVVLDGSASFDPDGDALTYLWSQKDGPTVDLQNADSSVASFEGNAGESYMFELEVRDSFGSVARDSVSVNMEALPTPDPAIVNFAAFPAEIYAGESATLSWLTTDAESVTLSGLGQVSAEDSITVSPNETTTYTLTATTGDISVTQDVTITVKMEEPVAPTVSFFTASPDTIDEGGFTTLSWSTTDADTVTISGLGQVNGEGSLILSPTETTTYTLTATNDVGEAVSSVTVTVRVVPEPMIEFFTATPDTITAGGLVTLNWSTKYADSVTVSGLGAVNPSGSLILSPEETTTYTLTATNGAGSAEATVTVTVEEPEPENNPPVAVAGPDQVLLNIGAVSLDGSGSFDPDGDTLTYSWQQVAGLPVTMVGADTATPSFTARGTATFRLFVEDGRGGTDTDEVTITVVSVKGQGANQ